MITELEQEFFKCFGIKPDCAYLFLIDGKGENKAARTLSFGSKADLKRFVCECGGKGKVIKTTDSPHIYYPEITDRILLELICILNKHYCEYYQCATLLVGNSIEEVKKCILTECLENANHIKTNIQQLFKGEE